MRSFKSTNRIWIYLGFRWCITRAVAARKPFADMQAGQVISIEGMRPLGLGAANFATQQRFARTVGDVLEAREGVPVRYASARGPRTPRLIARLRNWAVCKELKGVT